MKNLDRIFVVMLIVLPLVSVIMLAVVLTLRRDVTPDEGEAATPTPTFEILPISPTTTLPPTPTFDIANPTFTATATPTFEILPISPTPTKTPVVTATVTPTPTASSVPVSSPLPTVTQPQPGQPESTDNTMVLAAAAIVALIFGGLIIFGSILRRIRTTQVPASQ
jgi:hypothetical protein